MGVRKVNMEQILIKVVDSIMGSGKTSWVIDKINQDENPKYIYVTPTLSEVDRIIEACPNAHFKEPETDTHGKKYWHFKKLISDNENVATTHSLFKLLTSQVLLDIKARGYTLVIDEALNCVELYDKLSKNDLEYLFEVGAIIHNKETHKLQWNNTDAIHASYKGKFEQIRSLCENGNLIFFRGKTMLWEFPAEFLRVFKEVFVLTYLFKGSTMHSYLVTEDMKVDMYCVEGNPRKPNLVPYHETNEAEIKQRLRELITIYEGKNNDIGNKVGKSHPLSSTWFKSTVRNKPEQLKRIKNCIYNYFKHLSDSNADDRAWTTFEAVKGKLSGKGYAKGFIANNTKATNMYAHKTAVAYVQNTFYHPYIKGYFVARGVKPFDELWSLSEMLQFIWRFQIRQWKPLDLYIPSERMRKLFLTWLKSESVQQLFENLSKEFGESDSHPEELLDEDNS